MKVSLSRKTNRNMKTLEAKQSARGAKVAVAPFPALRHDPLLPKSLEEPPVGLIEPPVGSYMLIQPPKLAAIVEPARAATQSPYIAEIEMNCEECGGSGFDPGGVDPWGPEECPACHGERTQRITRNYLAEAFQIAANPDSIRPVERHHLIAVIQHCRQAVSALVSLPEVA